MHPLSLSTDRLKMTLQSPEEVLAWIETLPPEHRAEISSDWLESVRATRAGDYWRLVFEIRCEAAEGVIGGCGFKGPPNDEGVVEIAYWIEEEHQCRGYATEAAAGLVDFAMKTGELRRIRAHTLGSDGPSARVLQKCGFERIGAVEDPQDGLVERWERVPPV